MLGEFLINVLVLIFGYVYPALECFKTIEASRTEIDGLRFWCQYWVILALMSSIEKFGDIFISWLPLYGEFKLAFIVYLWHPRTMGTFHIYETMLRPFMAQHETDIDRRMQLMMSKAVDLLLFYAKNFVDKGQSMAFEIIQFLITRSSRSSSTQDGRPPPPSAPVQPSVPPPPTAPVQPTAPPLRPPWRAPLDPYRPSVGPAPPATGAGGTPLYPRPEEQPQEDNLQQEVNRVEEALRAAGVNLRRLRPHQH